jgi:hypothetical protein
MAVAKTLTMAEYARWKGVRNDLGAIASLLVPSLLTSTVALFRDFPQTYSSPVVFDASETVCTKAAAVEEIPAAEQVRAVLGFFGISKSDLARVLRVTRPTLYAWLDGASEPLEENQARLSVVAGIAERLGGDWPGPLFHGYVERPVKGYSKSLLEMLSDDTPAPEPLFALCRLVKDMTIARDERIERGPLARSQSGVRAQAQARNLEHNLSDFSPEA